MNRYPLWKYIAHRGRRCWSGFVYTLPNFFGEVPRCRSRRCAPTLKADDGAAGARRRQPAEERISPRRACSSIATGVKARFDDTDTQFKAKDVLQKRRWATTTSSR